MLYRFKSNASYNGFYAIAKTAAVYLWVASGRAALTFAFSNTRHGTAEHSGMGTLDE